MNLNYFKKIIISSLILIMVLPSVSSAYYYAPQSSSAQIAYLYTVIAQLQAQLSALQAPNNNPYYDPTYNPSNQSSNRVSAITDGVSLINGKVTMAGRVNFEVRDTVRVWFEYGTNRNLSLSTQSVDFSGNAKSAKSISIPASVVKAYTPYYYRLVVEDSRGNYSEGQVRSFTTDRYGSNYDDNYDDDNNRYPQATTFDAENINYNRARLTGRVDMNDYRNGLVFFVYGESKSAVSRVENRNKYSDIYTNGYDLRKVIANSSFKGRNDFDISVSGLVRDTEHFFRICVEFADEDNDARLVCGEVEEFETDY